ncbi:MAG: LLM class flavin-dependent oxidoreductase [Actinomycetota bacterium]
MDIGLALPHYDFSFPSERRADVAGVVEYATRAEDLGFDSVWVSDHLFLDLARYGGPATRFGTPEAFSMLSALASGTRRVRFGPLVLCSAFRAPALLAAQARSVNEASSARLELGLGAGWYEAEFDELGIPFEAPGRRIAHATAVAATVRAAAGSPPVFVGGKGGPVLMRMVARAADGWNVVWRITPEQYAQRLEVLRAACAAEDRDSRTVDLSVGLYTLVGTDAADLKRRYEALQAWMPGRALDATSLEEFAAGGLVGTPRECAQRIEEFRALGVGRVVLGLAGLPFSVYDDEQMDLVASELIPLVR